MARSFQRRAKPLLGTLVEIGLCVDESISDGQVQSIFDVGFNAIARIHGLMSWHEATSDLRLFNNAGVNQWVACHQHTIAVFSFAKKLHELSHGCFDICAGDSRGYSSAIEVDSLNRRLRKTSVLSADLGGIAKGYAVDVAVDGITAAANQAVGYQHSEGQHSEGQLRQLQLGQGVHGGWVNAGGDCRVFGDLSLPLMVRTPWGLDQPFEATLLRNRSAATSANHNSVDTTVMDGSTKQTAGTSCCAAVSASDCMIADALTKVVMATNNDCDTVKKYFGAQSWYFTNA